MSAHLIQQLLAELLEEYIGSAATQTAGEVWKEAGLHLQTSSVPACPAA